jgi:hypothetical protein
MMMLATNGTINDTEEEGEEEERREAATAKDSFGFD